MLEKIILPILLCSLIHTAQWNKKDDAEREQALLTYCEVTRGFQLMVAK